MSDQTEASHGWRPSTIAGLLSFGMAAVCLLLSGLAPVIWGQNVELERPGYVFLVIGFTIVTGVKPEVALRLLALLFGGVAGALSKATQVQATETETDDPK